MIKCPDCNHPASQHNDAGCFYDNGGRPCFCRNSGEYIRQKDYDAKHPAKKVLCSECGRPGQDVKPAQEYPELAELLTAWGWAANYPLLCPACAAAVCGDLRGETVKIIPLDWNKQDDERTPKK